MLKTSNKQAQVSKSLAVLAACALSLTGCGLAADIGVKALANSQAHAAQSLTMVIPAGYQINMEGHRVPVYGFDKCPPPDTSMSCVTVNQSAKAVDVILLANLPAGPIKETWSVEREGGKTRLRRPTGELVAPAL